MGQNQSQMPCEIYLKCHTDKPGKFVYVKIEITNNGSDLYEINFDDPDFICKEDRVFETEVKKLSVFGKTTSVEKHKLFKKNGEGNYVSI